ncbi:LytR/AlgR family response regulator transcription factor [Pseudorhodoferax sp.]|uniref:LytR/AlgR family response regulator transcription factor n=1 Tax=Pseudorhodoferax sp. TaxID=1993553 RepID=UPI001B747066|nr:LytTR family DNA-binding domain-containing protein [Pseudorhodoferax sp.]MBP8145340.1 response regulator transcription factor [Inhella sp.]
MNPTPRLLIADDEPAMREQLAAALALAWPPARIVAQAEHGADAWDLWLEHQPDACFLDIRMPGLSGIEVAQRIAGRSAVVFVSAYGDHALAAFDAGAVDYVVKPVDPARLAQAVARLRLRQPAPHRALEPALDPAADTTALQTLLRQLQPPRAAQPAALQAAVGKEVRLIALDSVLYFESDSRYTRVVYFEAGQQRDALLRTPLKDLLAQLDMQQFTQVHRSVIVASRQMASAIRDEDGGMRLRLRQSDDLLPVSRPFQGLFKGQ